MNVTSTSGIAAAWSASRAAAGKALALVAEKRDAEKADTSQRADATDQRARAAERETRSPPPPQGQGQRVDVRA